MIRRDVSFNLKCKRESQRTVDYFDCKRWLDVVQMTVKPDLLKNQNSKSDAVVSLIYCSALISRYSWTKPITKEVGPTTFPVGNWVPRGSRFADRSLNHLHWNQGVLRWNLENNIQVSRWYTFLVPWKWVTYRNGPLIKSVIKLKKHEIAQIWWRYQRRSGRDYGKISDLRWSVTNGETILTALSHCGDFKES